MSENQIIEQVNSQTTKISGYQPQVLLKNIRDADLQQNRNSGQLLGTIIPLSARADSHFFNLGYGTSLVIGSIYPGRIQPINIKISKDSSISNKYNLNLAPHLFRCVFRSYPCLCGCGQNPCKSYKHFYFCQCIECREITNRIYKSPNYITSYLYYINKETSCATYYRLNNVHNDGRICYGDSHNYPTTPLEAYSTFWAAPFTHELGLGQHSIHSRCFNKIHVNQRCYSKHAARSCLSEPSFLCSCPFAEFSIHDGNCSPAHYTKCKCRCCTSQCKCVCECQCCLNVCSCSCKCQTDTIYEHMESMKFPEPTTFSFKDEKFVSTKADGVFLSQNSYLMSLVPESARHSCGGLNNFCICAFAIRDGDCWLIDITGNPDDVLILTSNQVNIQKKKR